MSARLLIATDHKFLSRRDLVHDKYGFDESFFADYLAVFDKVEVLGRLVPMEEEVSAPEIAVRNLRFLNTDYNPSSARWIAPPPLFVWRKVKEAVARSDAVCARIPSELGWMAALYARKYGKGLFFEMVGDPQQAVVGSTHGVVASFAGRMAAVKARRVISQASFGSYVSARHLQNRYPAAPGTPTYAISSIRLPDDWILSSPRTRSDNPRVAHVGSFVPVKDHATLIRCLADLSDRGAISGADLVGDGPLRRETQEAALRSRVSGLEFHGHVSDRDGVRRVLDTAAIFVLSSQSEGMPRAAIEAMARGLPVVATRNGGTAELVRAQDLVPVGDAHGLARRVSEILESDASYLEASSYSLGRAQEFSNRVLSIRRREMYAKAAD